MKRYFAFCITLAVLSCVIESSHAKPKPKNSEKWTILFYWAVDNDLYDFSVPYFEALKKIPTSQEVSLFAEYDFPGDRSTERILITEGKQFTIEKIGEKNSADPEALSEFIDAGKKLFPADRTILVIGSHGSNWSGVISDETSKSYMKLSELRSALAGKKLDLVIFDACRMAFFETFLTLKNRADYFLASPSDVDGFNHVTPLTKLIQNRKMSLPELGKLYVESYPTTLVDDPNARTTASFITTKASPHITQELEEFFRLLGKKTPVELIRFRDNLSTSASADGDIYYDLFEVIEKAGASFLDLSYKAEFLSAKYTMTAKSLVLYRTDSKKSEYRSGIDITCAKDVEEYRTSLAGKRLPKWSKLCEIWKR
ncbi:MAG: hypothetical protein KA715_07385 [Xanthomonadaceae bacterium]|nr:hypothetical protein [Xanthomonadaceae bacterium]